MSVHVLIVDDNALNLELISEVLESAGYTVEGAGSAESALAAVTVRQPGLILMDIGLPGMDGYEAARRLKADPLTRTIPLVAVTAFAMTGDADRARQAGFDAHISKPIDTRALPHALARLLAERPLP
jgi:CheY-like chemotaxis protein